MERVLVFGATSAIAAEVARIHHARGDRLHLVARSEEKLSALASSLRGVSAGTADFADTRALVNVVTAALATLGGADRVLIAHGDLGDQLATERSFDEAEHVLLVNFMSVVALLIPIANYLESQRSGRIGVITSVAGDRGRPRNYTYGAAKGGLSIYLQGLRTRLLDADVTVTNLKLGPVDTPMTVSHEKNVLFGKPEPVAKDIVAAMDRGEAEAYVPWYWRGIMPVVKNTPEALYRRLPFLSGR
jgi:short-subunit dehydrogenase